MWAGSVPMESYVRMVEQTLLPQLELESVDPHDPVAVRRIPAPWELLGTGNYAAVLVHPDWPERAVKVYAPGRPGLSAEVEVYRRLGRHPAFSECYHAGDTYLVLKRLQGKTLFECFHRGIPIPERVIREIDKGLADAEERGLHPHDVHAKNVLMTPDGRGLVADISDFLEPTSDGKWEDLKQAYFRFYRPWLYRHPVPIPLWVLNLIRKSYRVYSRIFGTSS
jgi:hypothetical protein